MACIQHAHTLITIVMRAEFLAWGVSKTPVCKDLIWIFKSSYSGALPLHEVRLQLVI